MQNYIRQSKAKIPEGQGSQEILLDWKGVKITFVSIIFEFLGMDKPLNCNLL